MDKEQADKFWYEGGAASYGQFACTLIALITGLLALSSWKQQERAKRNYELAALILKDANAEIDCLNETRSGFYVIEPFEVTYELAKEIAEDGSKKLKDCAAHLPVLNTHGVVARNVFRLEVYENLNWLQMIHGEVDYAHVRIGFDTKTQEQWKRRDVERLTKYLDDAGLQKIPVREENKPTAVPANEYRDKLRLIRTNLDTLLGRYLQYD